MSTNQLMLSTQETAWEQLSRLVLTNNKRPQISKSSQVWSIVEVHWKPLSTGARSTTAIWRSTSIFQTRQSKNKDVNHTQSFISFQDYKPTTRTFQLRVTLVSMPSNTESLVSSLILLPETPKLKESRTTGLLGIALDITLMPLRKNTLSISTCILTLLRSYLHLWEHTSMLTCQDSPFLVSVWEEWVHFNAILKTMANTDQFLLSLQCLIQLKANGDKMLTKNC